MGREEGKLILGCKTVKDEAGQDRDGLLICSPKERLPDGTDVPLSSEEVVVERRSPSEWIFQNDGGMTTETIERFVKALRKNELPR